MKVLLLFTQLKTWNFFLWCLILTVRAHLLLHHMAGARIVLTPVPKASVKSSCCTGSFSAFTPRNNHRYHIIHFSDVLHKHQREHASFLRPAILRERLREEQRRCACTLNSLLLTERQQQQPRDPHCRSRPARFFSGWFYPSCSAALRSLASYAGGGRFRDDKPEADAVLSRLSPWICISGKWSRPTYC